MTGEGFWAFFALTVVVEVPVYVLLLAGLARVSTVPAILTALGVNLISYPLYVLVLVPSAALVIPPFRHHDRNCHGCVHARGGTGALLLANGCSVLTGLVVAVMF